MVTAGTYGKQHFFATPERLTILHGRLLNLAEEYQWMLQAWAVFSNHYHFVAMSPADPESLSTMINKLHWETAVEVNELDGAGHRKVWHNFWDTRLTYQKSYLARLKYVHYNPVKHGLCDHPSKYAWCSAGWFLQTASPAFQRTLGTVRCDRVNVLDPFEPILVR